MLDQQTTTALDDGIAAAKDGDTIAARHHLRAALTVDPSCELAWVWFASVAESPQESLDCFNRVLALNPDNETAQQGILTTRLQIGIAEAQTGNALGARAEFHAVLVTDPHNEIAWHWLASIAQGPEEARDCLKTVLEINPENDAARSMLREVEEELKALERVCPLCGVAGAEKPIKCGGCGALLSVAEPKAFLSHKGANAAQMKAAVAHYQKVTGEAADPNAHFSLGLALLNLKQFEPALAAFVAALQLQPRNRELRSKVDALNAHKATFDAFTRQQEQAQRRTVLVVDDSPTVRKLVALTLEKEGFTVVAAASGLEAADRIRTLIPDLILLDIMMPEMDGYQVCKLIKAQRETSKTPIIMLSGKDGFFDKIRGRMAGCTDYITKPFQPSVLLQAVKTHCRVGVG